MGAATSAAPQIRLAGVSRTFRGGIRALDGVSLDIPAGQFVCLIGPSGSGKSTLLRAVNRLVEPGSGRIQLDGVDILGLRGADLRRARRKIAMVFQQFNLIRRISVLDNVLTGRLGYRGLALARFSAADREMAWRCLARVDIAEKALVRADNLSGGQMQRVALARALAQEPEILLADEPVASLDPETAAVVLDYVRDINRQDGITVVCAMHHLDLAKRYADRIVAMRQGRIVHDGPPGDLDEDAYQRIYGRLGYD